MIRERSSRIFLLQLCNSVSYLFLVFFSVSSASVRSLFSSSPRSLAMASNTTLNCGLLACIRWFERTDIVSASRSMVISLVVNMFLVLMLLTGCTASRLDITECGMSLSTGFGRKVSPDNWCYQKPVDQPVSYYNANRRR